MTELHQRWLSLSGISTVLNLTPTQVKRLYNQKLLVRIGKRPQDYRYLDPTPEYAERLRLAAIMLSKTDVHINLPLTFLLTTREIAEIMGWTQQYAQVYLREKSIPNFKGKNRVRLYSVSAVRDLIWKRNGRGKFSKQMAPALIPDLINFFHRFKTAEEVVVPTDAAFAEDEALQKKIVWMMKQPSPQRETMLADFIEKMELAKRVVSETASLGESGTRQ